MSEETKRCPYCGEIIKISAKKCIHCKSWLVEQQVRYIRCPFCHEAVPEKAEKCSYCGEWLIDEHTQQGKGFLLKNPVVKVLYWISSILGGIIFVVSLSEGISTALLGFLMAILLFWGLYAYMFPSIYAAAKNHPQFTPILLINIFFGETVIGWIVAMVWASTHRIGRHTHW